MRPIGPVKLCLMATGAFLVGDVVLRTVVGTRDPFEFFVLPLFVIGVTAVLLTGRHWRRPVRALLALSRSFAMPLVIGALISGSCVALKIFLDDENSFLFLGLPGVLACWLFAGWLLDSLPRTVTGVPPWQYLFEAAVMFVYWAVNTVTWALLFSPLAGVSAGRRQVGQQD